MKRTRLTLSALFFVLPLLILAVGLATAAFPPSAHAAPTATIIVNSTADTVVIDGFCTLREAIAAANSDTGTADCTAGSGPDTITFSVNGTVTLGSQLPNVTSPLTIQGNGTANTIIQANANPNTASYRIIRATTATGNLTLSGVTLRHGGNATTSLDGGCIRADTSGQLTLVNSLVESCYGRFGGGVGTLSASLTVSNTVVQNNFANRDGGGIDTQSSAVTIANATITNNRNINPNNNGVGGGIASFGNSSFRLTGSVVTDNSLTSALGGQAGGLYIGVFSGGTAVISHSIITGNSSSPNNTSTDGGGIYYSGSDPLTLVNTVIANNSASDRGGGIYNVATGILTLNNVTISGNSAPNGGGGLYRNSSSADQLNNTLIANNTGGDCGRNSGTINAQHSLIEDGLTCINGTNSDNLSGDPALNVDLTLSSASHAINAGDNALIPSGVSTDLAGNARIQQGTVDLGAYESVFMTPLCFTEYTGDNRSDFGSPDAQAVRDAITAASPGGTIKIAGTCAGAILESGTTQVAFVNKTLTLMGGYAPGQWATSDSIANPTILDAQSGGRVLYATNPLTLINLTLQNGLWNIAGQNGGGAYFSGAATLSNTHILSNTTTNFAGGAYFAATATISGGSFRHNQSGGFAGGFWANSTLTLNDTQVLSNTANSNAAAGGVAIGFATINNVRFQGNLSHGGTGGFYAFAGVNVTNTQFINNTALAGGAGALYLPNASNSRIVNSLFAGNTASNPGSAMQINTSGTVEIIHTTIVRPSVGGTAAINVNNGTTTIRNTIITNHPIGIEQTAGTVNEDYNLFDGNTTNLSGVINSGGNSLNGAPHFVDPAHDNYRIGPDSAAVDAGINAGVTADFDGEARPQGAGFDIGYDELPQQCGLSTAVNYNFGTPAATLLFSNLGNIQCVAGVYMPRPHSNATGTPGGSGVGHDHFWQMGAWDNAGVPATGFVARMTLPHSVTPDSGAMVCKYPGTQGGFGWDCFRTGSTAGTVWLDGITSFSDWAVGNEVGPTAVTLSTFSTMNSTTLPLTIVALLLLLLTSTVGWLAVKRR